MSSTKSPKNANTMQPAGVIPPSPSRADYTQREDYTAQMNANATPIFDRDDPVVLFTEWMTEARETELNDSNAMSLATVDENGLPDVRMVLLKDFDDRGFVFYTNSESAKGAQLSGQSKAALCLHWKSLRRQVRVRGAVELVTAEEADAYFKSRARGSQIGAWASDQSRVVQSRAALEQAVKDVEARYGEGDIPRPPHWHGYRIVPETIEFWRDRPFRLHDRLLFTHGDEGWTRGRLFP